MMDQFAKSLKISAEVPWRLPVASLNYLETSTLWRQEHNGFSHQSPGFINSILNKKKGLRRVYLPPDANCLISTMDHILRGVNYVNLVIANKAPMPVWLTMDEAVTHCRAGASIWPWASTDEGLDPDVVLVGIGDVVTVEVMAAADILRCELPELRVRVVNVTDLLILEKETEHPHGLDDGMFHAPFTPDCPAIVNFHGYPSAVKQPLYGRGTGDHWTINGYREEGTTTTPFDMLVRNGASRYHLIQQAIRAAACEPFGFLGLELDESKNAASPSDADVAAAGSRVRVLIVKSQENWQIARECRELAAGKKSTPLTKQKATNHPSI